MNNNESTLDQAESNISKLFLTISELSIYLNLKESHLRRLIFLNEIPYFKIGRLIRFKRSEIDAWLEGKFNNFNDKNLK